MTNRTPPIPKDPQEFDDPLGGAGALLWLVGVGVVLYGGLALWWFS